VDSLVCIQPEEVRVIVLSKKPQSKREVFQPETAKETLEMQPVGLGIVDLLLRSAEV
jgi:hypothetical protein